MKLLSGSLFLIAAYQFYSGHLFRLDAYLAPAGRRDPSPGIRCDPDMQLLPLVQVFRRRAETRAYAGRGNDKARPLRRGRL